MSSKFPYDKLLIASNNPGKIREIKALLDPYNIEIISITDFDIEEPEETEDEWPLDGVDMGDSCEWTPTEHWIDANGGLTADAHQLLYEQESEGDLV